MAEVMSKEMELSLIRLVNRKLYDHDVYIDSEKYQKVSFRIYNENIIKDILSKFKFKDMGNVYNYPNTLPQPNTINGFDLSNNFDLFQKIAVSEKINSVAFYTITSYSIECTFLLDTKYLKKFSKRIKPILQQDTRSNLFREVNFDCSKREYIEISDSTGDNMKPVDVLKKKVSKEQLVFDEGSTIFEVMQDIFTFFKTDTRTLYEKMQIAYKRGIILYGNPGNGKSAMIREIIRRVPDISKIVINPNVANVTRILSSLIQALDGKQAIIIIEDIDSLISYRNRSEFLNILDGVGITSGVYFIGTTNYPEQIDPAFMNRSGRFDRTYDIGNPSENTRRAFFQSRNIGELLSEYKVFKDDSKPDTDEACVELFVLYTDNLPMASLKEVMTSTQYLLASYPDMSVEEAVEKTQGVLTTNKKNHGKAHDKYKKEAMVVNNSRKLPSQKMNALIEEMTESLE